MKKTKKTLIILAASLAAVVAIGIGGVSAAGAIIESNSVGLGNAVNIALDASGLSEDQVTVTKAKLGLGSGTIVYHIEYIADGSLYKYEIKASDGTVLDREKEYTNNTSSPSTTVTYLSYEEAKNIVLNDAGITDAKFTKIDLDKDDGSVHYEIEFVSGNTEYEYEIDAVTGRIISKETDRFGADITGYISLDDAKATAVSDFTTVNTGSYIVTKAELENENGKAFYEIVLSGETATKLYRIDATSGEIITSSLQNNQNPTVSITMEQAKQIALDTFGVTTAQFTEAKLDKDDNYYEFEFYTETVKYEVKVDATTGKAFSLEQENIAPSSPSITLEDAKSKALAAFGLSAATFTKAEFDRDDNCYEFDFYTDTAKYEAKVNATSGNVYDRETETINQSGSGTQTGDLLTMDEAKTIALEAFGLTSATFTEAKLDSDDGRLCYELEFRTDSAKYEAKVDATSGKVFELDKENISGTNNSGSTQFVNVDNAKQTALNHAGFTASQVRFSKAKLDYDDDNGYEYEIEFYVNGVEYEYEIDAVTGEIISFESEIDD